MNHRKSHACVCFIGLESDADAGIAQAKKTKLKQSPQLSAKPGVPNDAGKVPAVRRGSSTDTDIASKRAKIDENKSSLLPSPTATAPAARKLPAKRIFLIIL